MNRQNENNLKKCMQCIKDKIQLYNIGLNYHQVTYLAVTLSKTNILAYSLVQNAFYGL